MTTERQKSPQELEQERIAFLSWLSPDAVDEGHNLALRNMRTAIKEELTDRQREMMLLYYSTPRRTMESIARELGLNRSSVSRTLARGRKRLLRVLKYSSPGLLADTVKKGAPPHAKSRSTRKNKRPV